MKEFISGLLGGLVAIGSVIALIAATTISGSGIPAVIAGLTTLTSNGVLLGQGTSAITATTAGTANQPLRVPGAGGAPAFGAIDLAQAAAVTGLLPNANLATVGPGATGPLGSATVAPIITIDDRGRVTALTSATITPSSAATQAEMEAASSTTVYASPGRAQYHPGVAKAWVIHDDAGTVAASMNLASVTDGGVGVFTLNWTTAFSTANYAIVGAAQAPSVFFGRDGTALAAGSATIRYRNDAGTLTDPTNGYAVAFGDQ